MHIDSCELCAAQHQPCDNTYMACGGCCGTPWHKILGLGINTFHTCTELKTYFKEKNSCSVELAEPTQEEIDNDDTDESTVVASGGLTMVVEDAEQPKVIDEGILNEGCKTNVTKLECTRIPLSLKFECDDCG